MQFFFLIFLSVSFWFALCFILTIFNMASPVIQYLVNVFFLTGPAGLSLSLALVPTQQSNKLF